MNIEKWRLIYIPHWWIHRALDLQTFLLPWKQCKHTTVFLKQSGETELMPNPSDNNKNIQLWQCLYMYATTGQLRYKTKTRSFPAQLGKTLVDIPHFFQYHCESKPFNSCQIQSSFTVELPWLTVGGHPFSGRLQMRKVSGQVQHYSSILKSMLF